MRTAKSDEEVYMCVCARSLVLIPGRTSSGSELLGSSVGVSDVDTGKCRGREKKENDIERNERVRGIKGNSTIGSHFLNAHIHTHTQSEEKPPTETGCDNSSSIGVIRSR